ncbi:MAG: AAA family ATPase [Parcubacteria group bacterium]|nr:AAA family ATPase [Parcubacteria group bacterium]
MEKPSRARVESKAESLPKAEFKVSIDKKKLRAVDVDAIVATMDFGYGEKDDAREAKTQELKSMIENFARLPKQLEFTPGTTIIVGPNGSGKTTLAKALYYRTIIGKVLAMEGGSGSKLTKADVEEQILNPSRKSGAGFSLFAPKVESDGPVVAHIARALDAVKDNGSVDPSQYWDLAKEAGQEALFTANRSRGLQEDREGGWTSNFKGEMKFRAGTGSNVTSVATHSNRQVLDRGAILKILQGKDWAEGKPQLGFFDEPEAGMDPRRHMGLLHEVDAFSNPGSIRIVVTNSPILFANPDVPRIDLAFPERGIFYPRDYPGDIAKTETPAH